MEEQLPDDLDAWEDWPEPLDIDALISRIGELSLGTFREVIQEEVLDLLLDASIVATTRAVIEQEPLQKLRWLQEPLLSPDYWPDPVGEGWHVEFLELMWDCISVVKSLPEDPQRNSALLSDLLADPDIWTCPVAPSALLAIQPLSPSSADRVLTTFSSAWAREPDGSWQFRGSPAIESDEWGMRRAVPLVAIACLNPHANPDLILEVVDICTMTHGDDRLALFLWEYVCACLVEVEALNSWIPDPWWDQGFFGNGLPSDAPPVGVKQLLTLAAVFARRHEQWNLVSVHGEQMGGDLAQALAQRQELDDGVLRQFAALQFPQVRDVVRSHPNSSDETKALAAL